MPKPVATAIAVAVVGTLTLAGCAARDNSATTPPTGQKPSGGPVGGVPIEYAPECRTDEGRVPCARIATLASETVEVLSAGERVGNPTISIRGDRVVYEAQLPYTGPADGARDNLVAALVQNGWRLEAEVPAAADFTGEPGTALEGHRIEADFADDAGTQVLADITLSGPA